MVVAHHARHYFVVGDQWSNLGSRGVDIFFVISGFVMAYSTRQQATPGVLRQAMEFLQKRFVRVIPLYWLALLWTNKRVLWAGTADPNLWKDFVFLPRFHPVYAGAIFPSLVPGWSINYEVFFYLLFAVSLLAASWRFAWLSAILIALVFAAPLAGTSAPGLFYTSSVLLEFVLGIGVYSLWATGWPRPRRGVLLALGIVGFLLLGIENSDAVRGWLDGPCAALIVWCCVLGLQGVKSGWLHRLGDASYSIYLVHLASFAVPNAVLHRLGIEQPTAWNVAFAMSAHIAGAIVAGLVIHRIVERPLLRLMKHWIGRIGRKPIVRPQQA